MSNLLGDRPQSPLSALWLDPPDDLIHPARTLPQAIRSGSVNLNAVFYQAAGIGPHPTALLLHGLPGNEQNLDCAQALRRFGCNVLTIHYRGSWGNPGDFTIANCLDDGAAALAWLQDTENCKRFRVDRRRIVVIGHSMGGFLAAHLASEDIGVLGTAMVSGVDFETVFGSRDAEHASEIMDDNVGFSAGLHILAGTSREKLAAEARGNAARWCLAGYAPRLAGRPLFIATSNDGFASGSALFADAVLALDGEKLERAHFATDHSYSSCRIALQSRLLVWLATAIGHSQSGTSGDALINMFHDDAEA